MSESLSMDEQIICEAFNMVEWDGDWIIGHASNLGLEKVTVLGTVKLL